MILPKVPVRNVNTAWRTWLKILSDKCRKLYEIPSLILCQQSMPAAFKKHPNTRLIIDATEAKNYIFSINTTIFKILKI